MVKLNYRAARVTLDVAGQIDELARWENRSWNNMVNTLLQQAIAAEREANRQAIAASNRLPKVSQLKEINTNEA